MSIGPRLQEDGRVALPCGLRLTLQRAFVGDWVREGNQPPKSYGRLRFAPASKAGDFAIPILSGEHVWIGLEAPIPPVVAEINMPSQTGGMNSDTHLSA